MGLSGHSDSDDLSRLASLLLAGKESALPPFFTLLVPYLLRVARRVLGPGHPFVEDVAHDAAYTVVERLPSFSGQGSVLNFSRGIALHTALNVRRRDRAQKRAALRTDVETDELSSPAPDPEVSAAHAAALPAVRAICDDLPERLAEVLILHVLLGHTLPEVAEITRAPVDTVKSRLRTAKERFRARAERDPTLRDLFGRASDG
jgi:RNA polymerase sigma-70 factor (ECF subfamily)